MTVRGKENLSNFMKCRLGLDGTWVEVSPRLCDMLGYSENELKKLAFADTLHPEDRDEISGYLDKMVIGDGREFEFQVKFLKKSRSAVSVFLAGVLIRDRDGKPEYIFCTVQNLTELEAVKQKLVESKQQFESLFKYNPHPVYYFDLEGNFEGVNDKMVEFTGVSRKELLGMNFEKFIAKEDLDRTKKHFQKAAGGESGEYEIKVIVNGGDERDIRVIKFPRYMGVEITGVFGILQDITAQKNAEKELQENEQLFKSLYSYNPYPIMYFDLKGNFKDANKKAVEMSGLTRRELMKLDFSSFIAKEDLEWVTAHFQKAAAGEPQQYVVKMSVKDEVIEVETTLSPIFVEGKIRGLFCIAKDITEEKRAKRALENSEQRWQRLVEQNPQPVQIVQHGKIVFINQVGAEYFGASSPEELLGNPVLNFSHPDFVEKIKSRKRKLEKNAPVAPDEHKIILLNGEERYIEAHSIPISYKGDNAIQTVIHDITDLKEKQRVIGKSLKEKETLLQEIHHRVKNNLAVISALLELQIMKSTEDTVIHALRDSQLRIQSMAMIHEKLYQSESLSNIEFGDYLIDLVQAIKSTYNFSGKNIEILFDLGKMSLGINQAIPCSQIVNEVVVNCYKHAFQNKKKGKIRIFLTCKQSEITLQIADDGKGFPEDFEIEEQQSLGMTLIQTLSNQLGGTINFTNSSDGWGTVFQLNFKKETA